MTQQTYVSLNQLKKFLNTYVTSSHKDNFWTSILNSDIRNIIPKYEVCKIELVKVNLSKIRLIMQNLNTFISLQIHKKHLKEQMIDLNQNTSKQLQQQIKKSKRRQFKQHSHYDTQILQKRKKLQLLCKQLSRSKTSQELKRLLQKNKRWQQYLDKNIEKLQKASQQQKHEDIVNLLLTYEGLFRLDEESNSKRYMQLKSNGGGFNELKANSTSIEELMLRSGCYTRLYENKLRQKILIEKLVDEVYSSQNGEQQKSNETVDIWKKQVNRIRAQNNI